MYRKTVRKFICRICGYEGKEEEFKEENNPSSRYELIIQCPKCKAKEIAVYEDERIEVLREENGVHYWSKEKKARMLPLEEWMKEGEKDEEKT